MVQGSGLALPRNEAGRLRLAGIIYKTILKLIAGSLFLSLIVRNTGRKTEKAAPPDKRPHAD